MSIGRPMYQKLLYIRLYKPEDLQETVHTHRVKKKSRSMKHMTRLNEKSKDALFIGPMSSKSC